MMEYDIHTVLDALTLLATGGVIFCMMFTDMKLTYQKDQDIIKFPFVVGGSELPARFPGQEEGVAGQEPAPHLDAHVMS